MGSARLLPSSCACFALLSILVFPMERPPHANPTGNRRPVRDEQVKIPLITTNRINMPHTAERVLAEGHADMISMARCAEHGCFAAYNSCASLRP